MPPPPRRTLDYGRPETPMPQAIQWVLGMALATVVVTVVGLLATTSQGPAPGVCGALAAMGVLGLWAVRLHRGRYYRPLAASIVVGAGVAVIVVVACVWSIQWG